MRVTFAKMLLIRNIVSKYCFLGPRVDFVAPEGECDAQIEQMLDRIQNTDHKHLEEIIFGVFERSLFRREFSHTESYQKVAAMAGELRAVLSESVTEVVAAIIRKNGRLLICQRDEGGSTALLWEFPGGKVELHETLKECLIRECKEELAVDIVVGEIFAETEYKDANKKMAFTFFKAKITGGQLKANVHRDVRWVTARGLKDYDFCPADIVVVAELAKRLGLRSVYRSCRSK